MSSLYQEELRDHYKFPRNKGVVEHPTIAAEELNPSCGDRISLTGHVVDGVITELKFTGTGCVISQATASLFTEAVIGKKVAEVSLLDNTFIKELIGMPLGPTRLRCALLSLEVLREALKQKEGEE